MSRLQVDISKWQFVYILITKVHLSGFDKPLYINLNVMFGQPLKTKKDVLRISVVQSIRRLRQSVSRRGVFNDGFRDLTSEIIKLRHSLTTSPPPHSRRYRVASRRTEKLLPNTQLSKYLSTSYKIAETKITIIQGSRE